MLFVVVIFPTLSFKIFPTVISYQIGVYSVFGLTILQIIYLIRYLWKIELIEKKVKSNWTGLMILFPQIAHLIFIWNKVKEFEFDKSKNTLS